MKINKRLDIIIIFLKKNIYVENFFERKIIDKAI